MLFDGRELILLRSCPNMLVNSHGPSRRPRLGSQVEELLHLWSWHPCGTCPQLTRPSLHPATVNPRLVHRMRSSQPPNICCPRFSCRTRLSMCWTRVHGPRLRLRMSDG